MRGTESAAAACGQERHVACLRLTVDERVQDGHGTVGDTSVGVDLLED